MTEQGGFLYRAFGLDLISTFPIPELAPGKNSEPEVEIELGTVPEKLEQPDLKGVRYAIKGDRFLLRVDRIARYLVSGGRTIRIQKMPDATDDEVRLFLLGSVFGALLHQRGLLPLHGSAVETQSGGGVIFAGDSGAGKSTLAASLGQRGLRVLADDVAALKIDNQGVAWIQPGYPQVKLWADAAKKLKQDPSTLRRVRPQLEKYGLRLEEQYHDQPVRLECLCVLQTSNELELEITPITGVEKFNALVRNTYRLPFIDGVHSRPPHFRQCADVARSVIMARIVRPRYPFLLDPLIELVQTRLPL